MHYGYLSPFNTLFTQEAYANNSAQISCDKSATCSSGFKITDGSRCACLSRILSADDAIIHLYPDKPGMTCSATCLQKMYPYCAIDEVYNITNCKCEAAPEPEEPGCFDTDRLACDIRSSLGENVFLMKRAVNV